MAPLPTLKSGARGKLDSLLKATVATRRVPAIFYGATNTKETFYSNQAGELGFGDANSGQVDEDTTMELYSQSKFITSIAALQLVDSGSISLDSPGDIEKHLPEIGRLSIIRGYEGDDTPILVKPKNKITLRMLLSHSAGFTYNHTDPDLAKWLVQNPLPSILAPEATVSVLCTPLMYEPGTSWRYSQSIDWAGILVERVSGESLEKYFRKHIFAPCGVTSMTFFPTAAIKERKMAVCVRAADGSVEPTANGFGMSRPTEAGQIPTALLSGGGGLFGTQKDYLAVLRAILQCDPQSAHRADGDGALLSPASYAELFKPSVPVAEGCDGPKKISDMVSRPGYFEPRPTAETVNHSVGFMLNLEAHMAGRRKNSGSWSGAAKTQFWIDPSTGIAAICGTQLLSPAPDPWFGMYADYERELYAGLA